MDKQRGLIKTWVWLTDHPANWCSFFTLGWICPQLTILVRHMYVTFPCLLATNLPCFQNSRWRWQPTDTGSKGWLSTKDLPIQAESRKLERRYIGPYELDKVINLMLVILKLPVPFRFILRSTCLCLSRCPSVCRDTWQFSGFVALVFVVCMILMVSIEIL